MSCCSTDNSTCSASPDAAPAAETTVTSVYTVAGMTCGHCEQAVSRAVSGLDGVDAVSVDVAAGTLTVTSAAELDRAKLAAAVDDAGYELTGCRSRRPRCHPATRQGRGRQAGRLDGASRRGGYAEGGAPEAGHLSGIRPPRVQFGVNGYWRARRSAAGPAHRWRAGDPPAGLRRGRGCG